MSKKIYFSPSSQRENKYAVGKTNEEVQCEKIAVECVKVAKRCGFDAKTNTSTDMYGRVKESNEWGADLHIPIHTNAANKKVQGTRLFSYDAKGIGYKVCREIMETLAPITPGTSDSITPQTFYEITDAIAPTAYIEVAFHDNTEEAQWIIGHTEEIAEAIVKGLCNYYGMKYISSQPTPNVKKKTVDELAKEVIAGKWGDNDDRKKRLTNAGYDYDKVQNKVNELLGIKKKQSSIIQVGDKVKIRRAVDYNGVKVDSWVFNKIFPVIEVSGNRVVLGSGLNTAFRTSDLRKI